MTQASPRRAHPLLWVPSLYFAMGTPMIAVSVVAAIMYKNLGLSNTDIAAYTSAMYLPWALKPLWAPVVELYRTKRFFVLCMEFVMAVTFSAVALALRMPSYLVLTLVLFWVAGFASATQDIAADGVYISSLEPREQALYAGVQGMFWNLGRLLASGALVSLTGYLHDSLAFDWFKSWLVVMLLIAAIMALSGLWHLRVLPPGDRAPDGSATLRRAFSDLLDAWASFFKKRSIWMMLAVVFCYRLGEGFIEKMGPLFLLDRREVGGLGLDNVVLGHINGTVGTVGFVLATLAGGVVASRYDLKRVFVLLAFCLNVPHLTYFYLSHALPQNVYWIATVVTVEKIGYGFGMVGLMLYMMQQLAPGRFRTAHYAFATGIMASCMMLTGYVSGYLQEWLGHRAFFSFVLAASVPPIVLAYLAPFHVDPKADPAGAAPPH